MRRRNDPLIRFEVERRRRLQRAQVRAVADLRHAKAAEHASGVDVVEQCGALALVSERENRPSEELKVDCNLHDEGHVEVYAAFHRSEKAHWIGVLVTNANQRRAFLRYRPRVQGKKAQQSGVDASTVLGACLARVLVKRVERRVIRKD